MRTSFLTSLALGGAMVNAGVINKKRSATGLNVVYWGQNDSERALGDYCASGQGIDVIVLAFLSTFGNGNTPSGSFGDECDIDSSGNGSCSTLGNDIDICKSNGIKVLVSAGGAGATYDLSGDSDADGVAWSLWNEWAAPSVVDSTAPRPIGDSFVDGWDFDVEANPNDSGKYLGEVVSKLRSNFASDTTNTYYISGAPQCPLPEENMGTAIQGAQFDWLYIQFYNNDECSAYQLFDNDGGTFNYDDWVTYVAGTPSESAKLFVGLPASTLASTDNNSGAKYYVQPSDLVSLVSEYSSHAQFGGVMLWDAGYSDDNTADGCNYSQEVHSILNTGAAC